MLAMPRSLPTNCIQTLYYICYSTIIFIIIIAHTVDSISIGISTVLVLVLVLVSAIDISIGISISIININMNIILSV